MTNDDAMGSTVPLSLSADEIRDLGGRMLELMIAHFETLADQPVEQAADVEALRRALALSDADGPADRDALLELIGSAVFRHTLKTNHPRFFGYIPTPSNVVGALADMLASGLNPFAGVGDGNEGPTIVEEETVRWLCRKTGMGPGAGGLFQTGGSTANLTGLCVARDRHLAVEDRARAVIYVSSETHACVARALSVLGFLPDQLRRVEVDQYLRMDARALSAAIAEDRAAGRLPFCIVGSAGTTNTGAIDPLDRLADIARDEKLWLHIDGAYGASAVLCEEGRAKLAGLGRADSIVLDAHKWLFQPFECSILLVRDSTVLSRTFRHVADYMLDHDVGPEGLPNYRDMGMQTSRRFRAFKLWLSLKVFGEQAFADAVQVGLDLARYTQSRIEAMDHWHMVTPADFGIAAFYYENPELDRAGNDDVNGAATRHLCESGYALVSSTILCGHKSIRLCPLHPALGEHDIDETLARLDRLARRAAEEKMAGVSGV